MLNKVILCAALTIFGFAGALHAQAPTIKRTILQKADVPDGKKFETVLGLAELPADWRQTPVLCIAGRGPLDEAAALLLVDMLDKYGIGARVAASDQTSAAQIETLDIEGVRVACVSYLEPGSYKNARYQVRRLRKRLPGVPVMAIFWA